MRMHVSKLLIEFNALGIGFFYLTCREHYMIYDLPLQHYWLEGFSHEASLEYSRIFLSAYQSNYPPNIMIKELHRRGLGSFTRHPILLALVCIIHASSSSNIPNSPIGLIKRAIDTLTLRWDESKGVERNSRIKLDGEERVRCLMRIAYYLNNLIDSEDHVINIVNQHLKRQQIEKVDTRILIRELAQWYGLLVPVSVDSWGFTHRTIHDYLSARYYVESGEMSSDQDIKWNVRAAYAMSIIPDATRYLKLALSQKCEMYVLSQCLFNRAIFDVNVISESIIDYFSNINSYSSFLKKRFLIAEIDTVYDFFPDASTVFIESLLLNAIQKYIKNSSNTNIKNSINTIIGYSLYELYIRHTQIKNKLYNILHEHFDNPNFQISVGKGNSSRNFSFSDLFR